MIQPVVQPAGSAFQPPTLAKGVVAVPEPLTSEIVTQTVLRFQEGELPLLHHREAWVVTPDILGVMDRLMAIVDSVRSPDGGWPDDRPATTEQLLPYVMDEAMDVLDSLEKSWAYPGLPATHPFARLQTVLQDRLILADAIAHFLWGIARSSPQTMALLGGTPGELFQAGQEWTPGIVRLMAIITIKTPSLHWTLDLVTAEPPLPELHRDALVRWGDASVLWIEALLQSLSTTIQQETPLLRPLFERPIPSEVIAPSQPWQSGTVQLHLGLTFTPQVQKLPPLSPPRPNRATPGVESAFTPWEQYSFTLAPDFQTTPPSLKIPALTQSPPEEPSDRNPQVESPPSPTSQGRDLPVVPQEETPLTVDSFFGDLGEGFGEPEPPPVSQDDRSAVDPPSSPNGGHESVASSPETEDLFEEAWLELSTQAESSDPPVQDDPLPLGSGVAPVDVDQGAGLVVEDGDLFGSWAMSLEMDLPPTPMPDQDDRSPGDPGLADYPVLEDYTETVVTSRDDRPQERPSHISPNSAAVWDPPDDPSLSLDQWTIRWPQSSDQGLNLLELPRIYHVKALLRELGHPLKALPPDPHKQGRLLKMVELAMAALQFPDPPPTLLSAGFLAPEANLGDLVHYLSWVLIRESYNLTCLLSGITAQILQPEWGWESGILRLLPILKIQGYQPSSDRRSTSKTAWQIDLSTGAPACLETLLLLPDILVNIEGTDWQNTRQPVYQFRSELLGYLQQLLPEFQVLRCPIPVDLRTQQEDWQRVQVSVEFELGFQAQR